MVAEKKYISRPNNGNNWQVRIPTADGRVTKCFADVDYGGKSSSLRVAKDWRDETCEKHDIPLQKGRVTRPRRNSTRTTTGIIGITFRKNAWKAQYHDKKADFTHHRTFSCLKHGECEAFEMACQFRYKKCGKLKVYRDYDFPCEIPVPFEYVD